MNCPQCGTPNNDGFKFCMKCGANLPQDLECEQCGTVNPAGFQYCMQCGEGLERVVASPQKKAAPAQPPQSQKASAQPPPPSPTPVTPQTAPPAAPPQPQVVIIKEENKRRTPALLWILLGMLLVVMMCVGLLWLDIVQPPRDLVASLPDPLPEIVDAISHQQIPDLGGQARQAPEGDDEVAQAPAPEPVEPDPPAGDQSEDSTIIIHNNSGQAFQRAFIRDCRWISWPEGEAGRSVVWGSWVADGSTFAFSVPAGCYDLGAYNELFEELSFEDDINVDGTYHWYIDPPEEPSVDVCEEDLEGKLASSPDHVFTYGGNFSGDVYATFRAYEPLTLEEYDLYVEQYGVVSGPYSGVAGSITSGDLEGMYEITILEPFQHLSGPLIFRFTPKGEGCVLGEQETVRACASSEDYHHDFPYNGGCCTRGCWCQQSGQWGCWTSCDARCAE